jgi:hypothetical protein
MLAITALVTWTSAMLLGFGLLTIWLSRGGAAAGRSHIRRMVMTAHVTLGTLGLTLWVVYLLGGEPGGLAWVAAAVILLTSLIGAAMFLPWWRRRRRARAARAAAPAAVAVPAGVTTGASTDPAVAARGGTGTDSLPVERHFPLGVVVAHGILADLTLVQVVLVALGIGT